MAKKKSIVQVERIGRTSTISLAKHTRRGWDEWLSLLQTAGALSWPYKEITEHLSKKYKVTDWWRHIIANGFQVHNGLRVEGQNQKGQYAVTVTMTLPAEAKVVWKLMVSDEGQRLWLRPLDTISFEPGATFESEFGIFGEIRTMRKGQRVRMTWQDPEWEKPTVLQLWVVARPKGKSLLVFTHDNIREARLRESFREQWRAALESIRGALSKT